MTTRTKRLTEIAIALLVAAVGVLGWLTWNARSQLSDAKASDRDVGTLGS